MDNVLIWGAHVVGMGKNNVHDVTHALKTSLFLNIVHEPDPNDIILEIGARQLQHYYQQECKKINLASENLEEYQNIIVAIKDCDLDTIPYLILLIEENHWLGFIKIIVCLDKRTYDLFPSYFQERLEQHFEIVRVSFDSNIDDLFQQIRSPKKIGKEDSNNG